MSERSIDFQKATGMCPHGNFPNKCPTCKAESESTITPETAKEILGAENVLGAERMKEVFGVELDNVPELSFSKEELERAKENGETLILRTDHFDSSTPFTLQELVRRSHESGERILSSSSDISDELDWVKGMSFQENQTPSLEWKLVRASPIEETKHLSYDAQRAFMSGDFDALQEAMEATNAYWDELLSDKRNSWLQEHVDRARTDLPTIEALKTLRSSLPENAQLPSVIEALYDAKMRGGSLFENMAVVTADTVEPFEDEPERPIDLSFLGDRTSLHVRRDKRFGRPHKLGKDENFVGGIPIGYFQH